MKLSVVIKSKDEADRLRLTLASLARQSMPADVVVVDDGSRDHTQAVIAEAGRDMPLRTLRHDRPMGRCVTANAGARIADGDIVIFLDGDTLAGPGFVAAHAEAHARTAMLCGRGETYHLRQTRALLDPETASPMPGHEARLARLPPAEREALKVTRRQIAEDFDAIDRRAVPGIYPGAGPRALYDMEVSALREHPECGVLWAAASGSNFSVGREAFLSCGGFDEALDINAHRELALRLCLNGGRIGFVDGARSYHLTHRSGWRDPLTEVSGWETVFYRRHPIKAVKLLAVLWASLSDASPIPREARFTTLRDMERAALGESDVDYDAVRRLIPGLASIPA
jgi:glycosyltransferase involved in cell wall biosynthesis